MITGKKHGITDIHPDVVSYVSHAAQQRLQNLVEKLSETAQQKNISYKVTVFFNCVNGSVQKNILPLGMCALSAAWTILQIGTDFFFKKDFQSSSSRAGSVGMEKDSG